MRNAVVLFLFFLASCGSSPAVTASGNTVVGSYKCAAGTLDVLNDGSGYWQKNAGDNILIHEFTWKVQGDSLLLHIHTYSAMKHRVVVLERKMDKQMTARVGKGFVELDGSRYNKAL